MSSAICALIKQRRELRNQVESALDHFNKVLTNQEDSQRINAAIATLHEKINKLVEVNQKYCSKNKEPFSCKKVKELITKDRVITGCLMVTWATSVVFTGLDSNSSKGTFTTTICYGFFQIIQWWTDRDSSETLQNELKAEIRAAGTEHFKEFLDIYLKMQEFRKENMTQLIANHQRIAYPLKEKLGCLELWVSLKIDRLVDKDELYPLKRTKSRLFEKALQNSPKTPVQADSPQNRPRSGSFDFTDTYKGLVQQCGVELKFLVEKGNCFDHTGFTWKYGESPSNSKADSRSEARAKPPGEDETKSEKKQGQIARQPSHSNDEELGQVVTHRSPSNNEELGQVHQQSPSNDGEAGVQRQSPSHDEEDSQVVRQASPSNSEEAVETAGKPQPPTLDDVIIV